jgi:AmiR/NasT family two-component response regulator
MRLDAAHVRPVGRAERIQQGIDAGAFYGLLKPVSPAGLLWVVESASRHVAGVSRLKADLRDA